MRPFLKSLIAANEQGDTSHPHWGCTLVIDQKVELFETLELPAHFTLAGLGINGAGQLIFPGNLGGQPAIIMQSKVAGGLAGHTTIRDLSIQASPIADGAGLWLSEPTIGHVDVQRVYVYGFNIGVAGDNIQRVRLSDCVVDGNRTNVILGANCHGWRIRGCHIRSAISGWGVNAWGPLADLLVEGCRFESNTPGAIRLGPFLGDGSGIFGAVILGNRFESNLDEKGLSGTGVLVGSGVRSTRILFNTFSTDMIKPVAAKASAQFDTQIGLNASLVAQDEALVALE